MESIYSTPYLKTPVLPAPGHYNRLFEERKGPERPSSALGHRGTGGSAAGFNPLGSSGNGPSRARPTSSRKGGVNNVSAVERAVNYGRNVPNYLLPKGEARERQAEGRGGGADKSSRFEKLFDVDMVGRLDDIIAQHRSSSAKR